MPAVNGLFSILMVGAVGAIGYTLVKNPDGVKAFFDGLNNLVTSSYRASLGTV